MVSFPFRKLSVGLLTLASLNLKAQQPPTPPPAGGGAGSQPIELYSTQGPVINFSDRPTGGGSEDEINPYNSQAPYNPYQNPYAPQAPLYNPNAPYIPGQEQPTEEHQSLARLSGGVGLGMTNVGIINSMFRQTNDRVYKKSNASEFGFGVNGFLDFSVPKGAGALRVRTGAARVQVKPNAQTKSAYQSSQLENSETLFNFSVLYRVSLPSDMIGFGVFWAGAGFHMVYALSTGRFDSSGTTQGGSKLANSYGYSPLLSLGSELPFTSTEDFTIGLDWVPWKGFILMGGIKTTL